MVAITASVSDEVFDLLRKMEERMGKSRSELIRTAIMDLYAKSTGEEVHIEERKKREAESRGQKTVREIVERMREMGLMEAEEVPEAAVRNIIADIAGYDERTVQKYFKILDREMLLPPGIIITPRRPKNRTSWGLK